MVTGAKYTYDDIKDATMRVCFDCMQGRMRAFPIKPDGVLHVYEPFEKVAIDYKGPFPIKSVHNNNGFYLMSDALSSMVFVYPCKNKDEDTTLSVLEQFNNTVVKVHNHVMRKLQSDYDTVLMSALIEAWCMRNAISAQVSAPYSHAQNVQIERDKQNVLDKSRTLMASYNVPKKYWEYSVKCACYLINRSPTSTSADMTP